MIFFGFCNYRKDKISVFDRKKYDFLNRKKISTKIKLFGRVFQGKNYFQMWRKVSKYNNRSITTYTRKTYAVHSAYTILLRRCV